MASKEVTKITPPETKDTLLKIFYKISAIKSDSTDEKLIAKWVPQLIGTWASCDPYNPWRKMKAKFNYKKKGKK